MAVKEEIKEPEQIKYEYKTISYTRYDIDEVLERYLTNEWEVEFMSSCGGGSGSIYISYTLRRKI